MRRLYLIVAGLFPLVAAAQQAISLKDCLDYAVEHNETLQKDMLGLQTASLSKKEVVGALLPQISASAGFTDTFQKTEFAMPNFITPMLGMPMDETVPKYVFVTMGMDYSANWGASLAQQLVNFSLFNAVDIAREAERMAELGVEMTKSDVIAQTTLIYYSVQVLEYALTQFDASIGLMDRTLAVLNANVENGIMRQIDANRVQVTKTNLETERGSMEQALELQKKLLKLQMGFPIENDLAICPLDNGQMELMLENAGTRGFEIENLQAYRMLKEQQNMLSLQHKSAVYANLPVLTLVGNYSMNYMGNEFKGESFNKYPMSMVSLNLKMPLFSGLSGTAKVRKAKIELLKSSHDEQALAQSLDMNWQNARGQLEQQLRTVKAQSENRELAQQVFDATQVNYDEGISSLSDLLNAQSQLIQSQMNYVNALSGGVKAMVELKKADGTIVELSK